MKIKRKSCYLRNDGHEEVRLNYRKMEEENESLKKGFRDGEMGLELRKIK